MSETGDHMRKDEGKAPLHLIPPWVMAPLAHLYEIGAKKYGAWNYIDHPQAWSRVSSAMERHIKKWQAGERFDQTDGQHHMLSVVWGAITLWIYDTYGLGEDDRPPVLTEDEPLATTGLLSDTMAHYDFDHWFGIDTPGAATEAQRKRHEELAADFSAYVSEYWNSEETVATTSTELTEAKLREAYDDLVKGSEIYNAAVVEETVPPIVPGYADEWGCGDEECGCGPI